MLYGTGRRHNYESWTLRVTVEYSLGGRGIGHFKDMGTLMLLLSAEENAHEPSEPRTGLNSLHSFTKNASYEASAWRTIPSERRAEQGSPRPGFLYKSGHNKAGTGKGNTFSDHTLVNYAHHRDRCMG